MVIIYTLFVCLFESEESKLSCEVETVQMGNDLKQ